MSMGAEESPKSPEVVTVSGRVRGTWQEGLAVFRGIPFAAPPVGPNRLAAPRPAARWDGVRAAVAFGPEVPQETAEPAAAHAGGADDEWLSVNVWTREPDSRASRPVMVWIHGGGYKFGSSSNPSYDGRLFASEGDVVLVTLNYRVGMEGFAAIEGAPANRGLLDQVAALSWVQENIAAFGGDPAQVTVFGESAGAGSVAALLAMPAARGLFRAAIAQSVPGTYFSGELAADIGRRLAGELGLRATVEDLARLEPGKLATAGASLTPRMREYARQWGAVAYTSTPFSPVVDGEVLPRSPWQALADGAAQDVDLIVGHNRDEYRLFLAFDGQLGQITDEQASEMLRAMGPGSDPEGAYRTALPDASAELLYERVQSDWLFRMPSLRLAEAQVAGGGSAHVYDLTYAAPADGGLLGACHALDVPLVFGVLGGLGTRLLGSDPSPEFHALSSWWRRAWTAFATTGDPGWPGYDSAARTTCVIDVEPTVTPYPEEISRQLWQQHIFDTLPQLSG
jgi:para-nitrobenzyl esterase